MIVHDPNLYEPYFYCYSDKIWCGFDDGDSVYLKVSYIDRGGGRWTRDCVEVCMVDML